MSTYKAKESYNIRGFLVVEPHAAFRTLYAQFFQQYLKSASVHIVESFSQANEHLLQHGFKFQCCIVSVDVQKDFNGLGYLKELHMRYPKMKLIAAGVVYREAYSILDHYPHDAFFRTDFSIDNITRNRIFFLRFIKGYQSSQKLKLLVFVDDRTREMMESVEEFIASYEVPAKVKIINVSQKPYLAEHYRIRALPSILRIEPEPKLHFLGRFGSEENILQLIS